MPNKRRSRGLAGAPLALLALSACVPSGPPPTPLPAAAPAPRPAPPPPAPAPAPPPATDWATGPLSPGDWRYRLVDGMPTANFGGFAITCGPGHNVQLTGPQGTMFVIRTSFGERRLPASPNHFLSNAMLPASDPLLDQMAFSRGRFLVTAEGGASIVVPAWPEFARVIEDCRGQ